jgi:hypothetical protein
MRTRPPQIDDLEVTGGRAVRYLTDQTAFDNDVHPFA